VDNAENAAGRRDGQEASPALRLAGALGVVAVMALFGLAPETSLAAVGSYQVTTCNAAPEAGNNSWTWSTTDPTQPDHFAEHVSCPDRIGGSGGLSDQEGGLSTTDQLGLSDGALPGTSAGWTFTAPSGTTIAALNYERFIGHTIDPNNSWSPALRAERTIVPGETCLDSVENGETCSVGGPPGQGGESRVFGGLSVHALTVEIVCQAPAEEECVTGATQHKVWAAMYGATVTVADPTPPTLSAPSGSLWSTTEEAHAGTESATLSAQDAGGGVQSIVLSADGRSIASYGALCNFTFAQPCPASTGAQTLTLPTAQLSDGAHTIAVVATDAAGNQSSISEQINVLNSPPLAPTGVAMMATQPGGSSGGGGGSSPATIHISEKLKGRELIVHVKGRGSGKVRVSFTGRLHGRTVAAATKTVAFRGGKLTTTFKLGPRTAAHATIRVSARLDHQPAVAAVLKRQATARR
jgi:hypothetical protein